MEIQCLTLTGTFVPIKQLKYGLLTDKIYIRVKPKRARESISLEVRKLTLSLSG